MALKYISFSNWSNFSRNKSQFRFRYNHLLEKRKMNRAYECFHEWALKVARKRVSISMKKISAVVFFQNFLRRSMGAIKQYTALQIWKRSVVAEVGKRRVIRLYRAIK